jgi:hypothetical protein
VSSVWEGHCIMCMLDRYLMPQELRTRGFYPMPSLIARPSDYVLLSMNVGKQLNLAIGNRTPGFTSDR